MTTSFIGLDEVKYNALMRDDLCFFDDEELDALNQMGFIHDKSQKEFDIIQNKRQRAFSKQLEKEDTLSLVVLPTTKCNARCYYCYENSIKKERMSEETVESVIDFIMNSTTKQVHIKWFGGEPTLEPDIIDRICSALKESGIEFSTSFVSNGYLLNELFVKKAVESWNFRSVQITLDAIGKDYDRIKNYIYSSDISPFDIVVNNIKNILANKAYVNIRINYNPEQYEKAIEVIDYVRANIGISEYLTVYASPITGKNIKRLIEYGEDFNPQIAIYEHLITVGYLRDFDMVNLYPRLLNCSIHYEKAYIIDTNGMLYKCQHAIINKNRDSIGTVISDRLNQDVLKRWDSLNFSYDNCKECKYLPVCLGGCRFYALNNEKFYACYQLKNSFISLIKLLYKKIVKGGAV